MRKSTGIFGLDDILGGGFASGHLFLIEGDPGAGKTTLALQFLLEGARLGERGLYITLSETKQELHETATAHGWSLDKIEIFALNAAQQTALGLDLSLFHAGEIELGETMQALLTEVERIKPSRVVLDSLSELRLLAEQSLRYRRQILAIRHHFADTGCTVVLLDDRTGDSNDRQVHSLAHGVVMLEQLAPGYGAERRRLRVSKLRGSRFRGGFHDYVIETGGLQVFPRLVAAEHRELNPPDLRSSGDAKIDAIVGGGLSRGTSTLIAGPSGVGKSTLASVYVCAAASRGDVSSVFLFDESVAAYGARADSMGLPLRQHVAAGLIRVHQIDPAELSPGEFAHRVRSEVDEQGAQLVVIDSLNGYLSAMPEEKFLVIQMHELLAFLGQRGVLTFLIATYQGLLGSSMQASFDPSYLADNVFLLRYFEAAGRVRNAISMVKKRIGPHERTLREFQLGHMGLQIGDPLEQFHGVLSGIPRYIGQNNELIDKDAQ